MVGKGEKNDIFTKVECSRLERDPRKGRERERGKEQSVPLPHSSTGIEEGSVECDIAARARVSLIGSRSEREKEADRERQTNNVASNKKRRVRPICRTRYLKRVARVSQ